MDTRIGMSPDGSLFLSWVTPDGLVELEVDETGQAFLFQPKVGFTRSNIPSKLLRALGIEATGEDQ